MSALNDRPKSVEEEINNRLPSGSSSSRIQYDPFRQSLWAPGPFGQRTGRLPPQNPSAGSDLPRPRPPLDVGSRQTTETDNFPRQLQTLSSPPGAPYSPLLPSAHLYGSASDRSSASEYLTDSGRAAGSSGGSFLASWTADAEIAEITPTMHRARPRGPQFGRGDEFDGPTEVLPPPLPEQEQVRAQALLQLPCHLSFEEQEGVARRANDIMSHCAFHFVAKYSFPIPLERDKRRVRQPSDRDWTEWAYLIKRLATKRRIPKRFLYDGQIKQLVTTLENSIAVRQPSGASDEASASREPRDDRYMLQLVSSGLQVAKILMDSLAMQQLNQLYVQTETLILERRSTSVGDPSRNVGIPQGVGNVHGAIGRGERGRGRRDRGGGVVGGGGGLGGNAGY